MTPERMAELVRRWVRWYTRTLPPSAAERRVEELDADLHAEVAHGRAQGTGERRIALGIAARALRGMPADLTTMTSSTRKEPMPVDRPLSQSVARVAAGTALLLLIPLVLMQVSDGTDWGVFDFVFAGVLLFGTGMLLQLAVRSGAHFAYRAAAAAVGVAAIVFGEMDDAPGLVGFGFLLILAAIALSVRTRLRSS